MNNPNTVASKLHKEETHQGLFCAGDDQIDIKTFDDNLAEAEMKHFIAVKNFVKYSEWVRKRCFIPFTPNLPGCFKALRLKKNADEKREAWRRGEYW